MKINKVRMTTKSLAVLCVSAGLLLTMNSPTLARESRINSNEFETIESITITATKTSRHINEIASNVTRIQSEVIDAISANNIRDLLRYEPGVSVEGSGRFGLEGFNIRGINGDRVLILLDGVPIADEFSFGPALSSRRDFIDIDLISSVDIIRGPASTLYGSDAIGGVVAFNTKDPADLLAPNEAIAGRVKIGYAGQANEYLGNLMLAGANDNQQTWQWLINASVRRADETKSFFDDARTGSARTASDPQDNNGNNVLAKLIYSPKGPYRVEISADKLNQKSDTQLLSEQGTIISDMLVLSSVGKDQRTRERISIDYTFENDVVSHFKRFTLLAFSQRSETEQFSLTQRQQMQGSQVILRSRDSQFKQDIIGAQLQFDHAFSVSDHIENYLIYGAMFEKTESNGLRNGQSVTADNNQVIPEFSIFPARDFPPTELTEYSVFIQNEISLLSGALTLSPGLRYDEFSLVPELDAIFSASNPSVEVANFKDSEISAKLGVTYRLNKQYSLWYQYAEGFRIPPMDAVNVGFANFIGGYTSLANPELQPESVISHELGFRAAVNAFDASFSVYQNRYDNFIEPLALLGFNRQTNLLEFQARNVEQVKINGVDASLTWYVGESFSAASNWILRASYSKQDSEDTSTGDELESILPAQSVIGLSYGNYDAKWRFELAATHSERGNALNNMHDMPAFFVAPSHTLIDILGHYQLTRNTRINLGLFNLFDKEYYLASEVRGRTQEENLGRFSAPGRNISMNVVVNF